MIVYAESSAILSWLLGETEGGAVAPILARADFVVSSELTLVECDRVLHRAAALGSLSDDAVDQCRSSLRRVAASWIVLTLGPPIVQRARGPFPDEPIRSLDALHLASALEAMARVPEMALLSLDQRVRRCGRSLGFEVLPPGLSIH